MENESSFAYAREQLKSQLQEVEQQIALLDGNAQGGPELDQLHQRHAELTQQLEAMDAGQGLEKAA